LIQHGAFQAGTTSRTGQPFQCGTAGAAANASPDLPASTNRRRSKHIDLFLQTSVGQSETVADSRPGINSRPRQNSMPALPRGSL
jgi:hypothetical protein